MVPWRPAAPDRVRGHSLSSAPTRRRKGTVRRDDEGTPTFRGTGTVMGRTPPCFPSRAAFGPGGKRGEQVQTSIGHDQVECCHATGRRVPGNGRLGGRR